MTALDDFVFHPALVPLVDLADIIKVDFRLTPMDEISRLLENLSDYKGKLLADTKPEELVRAACIKSKFCERLASVEGCRETPGEMFTLGLFSNIDAILDQSMEEVMKQLPLADRIKTALVDGTNELGRYLALSKHYEKGEWDRVCHITAALGISEDEIPPIYVDACEWANGLSR